MLLRPPRSTLTDTPFPYTTLFRSREMGVATIGFTGAKGESMRASCDHLFVAPTDDTPVVQQVHMMAMHAIRSEEHTSELQSLMRISYAVFCLKKKKTTIQTQLKSATLLTYHK